MKVHGCYNDDNDTWCRTVQCQIRLGRRLNCKQCPLQMSYRETEIVFMGIPKSQYLDWPGYYDLPLQGSEHSPAGCGSLPIPATAADALVRPVHQGIGLRATTTTKKL